MSPLLLRVALGASALRAAAWQPALGAWVERCPEADPACEAEDVAQLLQTRRISAEQAGRSQPGRLVTEQVALLTNASATPVNSSTVAKPVEDDAAAATEHPPVGEVRIKLEKSPQPWNAIMGFVGLGLLLVGLQVIMAECLLLDHGGLCMCLASPVRLLLQAGGRLRALVGRMPGHLPSLSSCCWAWPKSAAAEAKLPREHPSILRKLPPETSLFAEVASWLSAAELFRLGMAARELRKLPDDVCTEEQLLQEVKRWDLEHEWGTWSSDGASEHPASVHSVSAAEAPDKAVPHKPKVEVPGNQLRRFFLEQAQRSDEEEQQMMAARRWQACLDFVRFLLLAVCWATFLCEVVQLAQAGENYSILLAMKAIASPFLFLYVLENSELRPGRSALVTCIAFGLLYECIHNHGIHIVWHRYSAPQVPYVLASGPAKRWGVG